MDVRYACVRADAEVADATHQRTGVELGGDLSGVDCGVQQRGADWNEALSDST
ncbi:hypothetical protein [Deinococcus sedimenti]|uniref:Uncharacterized protein n=1 Tax=Deinococcus sedimenti TaxID=1867090 RepID=A0ABQ2S7D4_9DEIO|nr:hypothetical protein [Deinococcus sedimenti]GGR93299.1 hypothetical protein GCM10008960_20360 [Deinococcus sedimenti]